MGVKFRHVLLMLALAGAATAAPKLRLSTAAVGPVFVTQGQNGPSQAIQAAKIGDGALTLAASSNVPWITVAFGAVSSCALSTSCTTVGIGLSTSTLSRGQYTGVVTLTDPHAIDAPQTFTVTIQVGSAVPDSLDLYVPPTGSASSTFTTGSLLNTSVQNQAGAPAVSIAAPNVGTFATSFSYVVSTVTAGTAVGHYQANISVTGSKSAVDNKLFPVRVHVTTDPIADFISSAPIDRGTQPRTLAFRIAQGSNQQVQYVTFTNLGQGTLTFSTVSGAPAWLTTKALTSTILQLTADATGMNAGVYTATISVATNAKNGAVSVPVQLTVLTSGPPVISYQGVVDNALFKAGDAVAPGGIVAIFGDQLRTGAPAQATSLPLQTTLGGVSVSVNGGPAPVYYVSANQINFIMPYATPAGTATVQVSRDGQAGNTVTVAVVAQAPRLLRLGIGDYPIATFPDGATFPLPVGSGLPSRPAKSGDVLIFYSLGFGQTNPPASDGVAAPFAQVPGSPKMIIGQSSLPDSGVTITPDYVGLTPGLVGLYQVNVTIPEAVPKGDTVSATLDFGGGVFSNRVVIAIQ